MSEVFIDHLLSNCLPNPHIHSEINGQDFEVGKIYEFSGFRKTTSRFGVNSLMCNVNNKRFYTFHQNLQRQYRAALINLASETQQQVSNYWKCTTSYWKCINKIGKDIPILGKSDMDSYELQELDACLTSRPKPIVLHDSATDEEEKEEEKVSYTRKLKKKKQ